MSRNTNNQSGKVYLVGAGPGDPGLLTVKGAAIVRLADVVIYDYLANPELLLDAKPGAELIYAGIHSSERLSQDEINRLLVAHAQTGKNVCRLKGGDPFIFGRGGEEAEFVAAAGIPFEIVPGVSAGYAVPAYAGIPLTHRKLSSSVAFITGHEDPVKESGTSLDWSGIARGAQTLVFYMSVKNFAEIASKLIDNGRAASTPAAMIRWGTRGDQQVVTGTLADIGSKAGAVGLKPPALAVVGEVVSLRSKLQWFELLPLFGERVLITRARDQASELSGPLRAQGAETIELPVIEIRDPDDWSPLDDAVRSAALYDWIIFTSANGVRKFMERVAATGTDIRSLASARLCAIGPATAAALRSHLLNVAKVPDEYRAEGVLAAFTADEITGKRILIPRAKVARDILPEELRKRGAEVTVVEAYHTVLPVNSAERLRSLFQKRRPTLITFTSSSTVENFLRLLDGEDMASLLAGVRLASIGPITSGTLRKHSLPVDIEAHEFTIPSLIDSIVAARR